MLRITNLTYIVLTKFELIHFEIWKIAPHLITSRDIVQFCGTNLLIFRNNYDVTVALKYYTYLQTPKYECMNF